MNPKYSTLDWERAKPEVASLLQMAKTSEVSLALSWKTSEV